MALAQRLVVTGLSAIQAQAIQGTSSKGLTATGTVQGNAFALPADVNKFGTVGAGSGAILPAMNGGDEITVFNGGANALLIYPPVGGIINGLSANTAYSVATATPTCFIVCVDPLTYIATQSA
jgi:hypothetical protein